MKSAIIGVGTELTDGQIVNKNASWISARLKEFGLQTTLHLVVPDDRTLILEALAFCTEKADVLFITGGLGPTTDDFTRELIAEWSAQEMQFDQFSLDHLTERLTSRGIPVQEMQRQQCFYPKGAKVLVNPHGTANAFYMDTKGRHVFVLPGPPREIEAIWEGSIHTWLMEKSQGLDPYITRKWDTIGLGESDIAARVEKSLTGIQIDKGYRVHLPYVEVKLSYYKSQQDQFAAAVESVDKALNEYTLTREGEDIAESLAEKLKPYNSLLLVDSASGSYLIHRLLPVLRKHIQESKFTYSNTDLQNSPQDLLLELKPSEECSCEVSLKIDNKFLRQTIVAPYKTANMHERRLQYFTEYALAFWLRNL